MGEGKDSEGIFCQFIDYGTKATFSASDFREPSSDSGFPLLDTFPAQASECKISYCKPPRNEDEELCLDAGYMLKDLVWEKDVQMAVDFTPNKVEHVTLKVEGQD